MEQVLFSGVCTALVTPFLDNQVNYPMMERLLQRQCDAGIDAVVICGTTGEAPTLTDEEKLEMFSRAKKFVGNSCKIIAGTGSNSTAHTLHLSKAAEACGVDGLLVVTPYYNKTTPDGLIAHYMEVAQSVDLPVIVYNVPSRTGLDVPVAVYQKLSGISNIAGTKEASTDITKLTKIQGCCGSKMTIWSGNDEDTASICLLGGKGVISVVANILPAEMHTLTRLCFENDYAAAGKLQLYLKEFCDAMFCEVNPIPVKTAMNLLEMNAGTLRLPLCPISDEHLQYIRQVLVKYKLLETK